MLCNVREGENKLVETHRKVSSVCECVWVCGCVCVCADEGEMAERRLGVPTARDSIRDFDGRSPTSLRPSALIVEGLFSGFFWGLFPWWGKEAPMLSGNFIFFLAQEDSQMAFQRSYIHWLFVPFRKWISN